MNSTNFIKIFVILGIFVLSTTQFVFSQNDSVKTKEKELIIVDDNSDDNNIDIEISIDDNEEYWDSEEFKQDMKELEDDLKELAEELGEEFGDDEDFTCCNKKQKKFKGHWAGFEFGLNNFVVKDLDFNLPQESEYMELKPNLSWTWALNLPEVSIPLYNRYVGFVSGLGLEWNSYRLKRNIDLEIAENGDLTYLNIDRTYEKNSLNAFYLNIPFILEGQIPVNGKDDRIFIGVGVVGGVKFHSNVKKTYLEDGQKRKLKDNDDYNLNPFKYGLTARIGYKDASLFANYNVSTLFEKGDGPELYPVSVGLRIDF